jgi:hypothetical protein
MRRETAPREAAGENAGKDFVVVDDQKVGIAHKFYSP